MGSLANAGEKLAPGGLVASGRTAPPATVLRALDLIRERRFAAAEAKFGGDRLRDSETSVPGMLRHFKEYEAATYRQTDAERAAWETGVVPALKAAASSDAGVQELAGALGVDLDDDLFERFVDKESDFSIGDRARGVIQGPPADLLEEALGLRVDAPVAGSDPQIAAILASPKEPLEADGIGLHLTRPGRRAGASGHRGKVFDHHGLYLGDGTVVHFDGEPTDSRPAAVRRTNVEDFRAGRQASAVGIAELDSIRGRKMSPLKGNIAALRAMSVVGDEDYNVLARNCEHFAMWALVGVSHSSQTRALGQAARLAALVPGLDEKAAWALLESFVEQDVAIRRRPLAEALPEGDPEGPLILDLARAFWSEDLDGPVFRFPLWRDRCSLPDIADRCWSQELSERGPWTALCAGVDMHRGWHACLVAVARPTGDRASIEYLWVTSEGHWHRPDQDVLGIIEARLTFMQELYEALWSGATDAARRLVRLDGGGFSTVRGHEVAGEAAF